jgi:hypothetical protein
MGNENERKHDPAENRREWLGHEFDEAKTGGSETNVGQTGAAAGTGGMSTGSGGVIGGSSDFLTDPLVDAPTAVQQDGGSPDRVEMEPQSSSGNQQNLGGQQGGDTTFGGSGSGSSFMASNTGQSDLGSAGIGAPDDQGDIEGASDPGGQAEPVDSLVDDRSRASAADEGSDTYLQPDALNPELAREDSLDQQLDGGAGLSAESDR